MNKAKRLVSNNSDEGSPLKLPKLEQSDVDLCILKTNLNDQEENCNAVNAHSGTCNYCLKTEAAGVLYSCKEQVTLIF